MDQLIAVSAGAGITVPVIIAALRQRAFNSAGTKSFSFLTLVVAAVAVVAGVDGVDIESAETWESLGISGGTVLSVATAFYVGYLKDSKIGNWLEGIFQVVNPKVDRQPSYEEKNDSLDTPTASPIEGDPFAPEVKI